jgi:hypothetical protein
MKQKHPAGEDMFEKAREAFFGPSSLKSSASIVKFHKVRHEPQVKPATGVSLATQEAEQDLVLVPVKG